MKKILVLSAAATVLGMSGAAFAVSRDDCVQAVERKYEQCINEGVASRHNVECERKRKKALERCDKRDEKLREERRDERHQENQEKADRIRERLRD